MSLKMQSFPYRGSNIISPYNFLRFCTPFFKGIQTFNSYFWSLWIHNQYSGFKNNNETLWTIYQKYWTEIPTILFNCKKLSKAKSQMKPKFLVPVHHDIEEGQSSFTDVVEIFLEVQCINLEVLYKINRASWNPWKSLGKLFLILFYALLMMELVLKHDLGSSSKLSYLILMISISGQIRAK